MKIFHAIVEKRGNFIGVTIPKEILKKENIKLNDKVEILIRKKSNPIKETFGTLKFKKSTEQMLKETDEELWND